MGALMKMYCNVEGLSTLLNIGRKYYRPDISGRRWGRIAVGSGSPRGKWGR